MRKLACSVRSRSLKFHTLLAQSKEGLWNACGGRGFAENRRIRPSGSHDLVYNL